MWEHADQKTEEEKKKTWTRRKFFGMVAGFLPLGLFGVTKKKPDRTDIRVKRWYETARTYKRSLEQSEIVAEHLAKDRDYWRERCLALEKAISNAISELDLNEKTVDALQILAEVEYPPYYTHPDCLSSGPDEDILSGRIKSFSTVDEMLESLKETPW